MRETHEGIAVKHQGIKSTTRKILVVGVWWPTLFEDMDKWVKTYNVCQRAGKPSQQHFMPMQLIMAQAPFDKWGLDFVGPISPPNKCTNTTYILVTTDFMTKQTKAKTMKTYDAQSTSIHL